MDDINNIINFGINENNPILASLKVNDNDILNGSAERSAAESVAFIQSSPLAEKQVLTNVNNNFKNEEPNISFTAAGDSTVFTSKNSEENISLLSLEAVTVNAESINSSSLVNETLTSTETSNCISINSEQNNSGCGNESESDSYAKSAYPCLDEISVGNVNFLPDAVSNEVVNDNHKNLSDITEQFKKMSVSQMENGDSISKCVEELKHEKNNSCMVVPDLVDFAFREKEIVIDDFFGSFTGIDSVSKQPEPFSNATALEISDNKPAVKTQENKPVNTSVELLENECANKGSASPATNRFEEAADATKNYIVLGDSTSDNSPRRLSENAGKEAVSNAIAIDDTLVELEKPSKVADGLSLVDSGKLDISTSNECREVNSDEAAFQGPGNISINESDEISPLKMEKVSFGMSDKHVEKFSDISADDEYKEASTDEAAFQVLENISNNETGEVSPLKVEKVSFDMPDRPLEQFSDSDFAFKMPEVPSNNPLEQFSDPDFAFKMPEVPSNNPLEQFSDPDFAFKMPEVPSNNIFRNPDFVSRMQENPVTNEGDEQFVDAVQFFKDPNSFQFLENIRTSVVQSGSPVPRSSLYVNFDPLHSKFQNVPKQDNCALITAAVQENNASVENTEKCSPEVVKKHLVDVAARESLGNILISFDSPKSSTCVDSKVPVQTPTPPKMITEEEHQQILKIHELETQEAYLKKQKEMEMQLAKRDELLVVQQMIMEEFNGISGKLSEEVRKGHEKIICLEAENEKLKEDLKTSSEDLQSVENTFTDFYKRYEQCKGMLKSFKDNEENLKQKILDLQAKEKEQDQMYLLLKERTEEMVEKANIEMDNVKRSGEAQLTVLKAQLKKAEMKISSLESDNKQIKIENSQLGGICDDLMAKVSRS